MRTAFILSALAFIVPALGAPTLIPIIKSEGPVKPDSYIVKFKDDASRESALAKLDEKLKGRAPGSSMTYNYSPLFNGIAATLQPDVLEFVRSMSEVDYMEHDSILSLVDHVPGEVFNVSAPAAPEHSSLLGRGDQGGLGQGVTIYDIDTGVYVEHECFEGRATWGAVFGDYAQQDGNGHGTHTAGTAAGKGYGIATSAKIIAVKVLSDTGSGALSDVMAGVNYASNDSKGKLAIATMSLGASDPSNMSKALDETVKNAIDGGLHLTIAAGNSNMDAKTFTPARVVEANTIGAVDSNKKNQKASFSNWGKILDVWAPGVNIRSAWIGNPKAENTISGTSMATPFVAGLLAVALGKYGPMSPADLSAQLKEHAKPDVTFSFPADIVAKMQSNNLLAQKW